MRHRLILLLLLAAGCSGSFQTGISNHSSTEDMAVDIDQMNAPIVMSGHTSTDVLYRIVVKNRTQAPLVIDRIAMQSMGGSYHIPMRARGFDGRTIAPGAQESFDFWATVQVDPALGTSGSVTLRAIIYAKSEGKEREETFIRRVNGLGVVSTSRGT